MTRLGELRNLRLVAVTACMAAAAAAAGGIAGLGYGGPLLVTFVAAGGAFAGRKKSWGPALGALPIALFPPNAMTVTTIHGIPVSLVIGVVSAAAVGLCLAARGGLPLVGPLFVPVVLFGFGAIEGGLRATLHVEAGTLLAWCAGAALGAVIATAPEVLSALMWLLLPTALLIMWQSVGMPNVWASASHADLFLSVSALGTLSRGFGTYGHPIPAGAICASLALAALTSKVRHWEILSVAYGIATVATLSRSALVAGGVGAISIIAMAPGGVRRRAVLGGCVAAVAVAAAVVIPSPLSSALATRVNAADNAGRVQSLQLAERSIDQHFGSVLFGGGFQGAQAYYAAVGGDYATGSQSGTLVDNGAISAMYDFGLVPILVVLVGVAWFAERATAFQRRAFVPPLLALAASFLFFDGLSWLNTSFFFFMFLGALAIRPTEYTQRGIPLVTPHPNANPIKVSQ